MQKKGPKLHVLCQMNQFWSAERHLWLVAIHIQVAREVFEDCRLLKFFPFSYGKFPDEQYGKLDSFVIRNFLERAKPFGKRTMVVESHMARIINKLCMAKSNLCYPRMIIFDVHRNF